MRGRLVLVLAVALAACQSGGGSNGTPPIPIPPWGNFRHDISNSATNTSINNNDGIVSTALSVNFTGASEIVVNESTPTLDNEGNVLTDVEALDYWADVAGNPRVAFVAHPESGGMSLTLTESRMSVFWSNSFKPEYRSQAEDRIHRKGMDENLGCTIVDLVHLPSDERVIQVISENRRLELMTMGEFPIEAPDQDEDFVVKDAA
jgi:hypothetical protein